MSVRSISLGFALLLAVSASFAQPKGTTGTQEFRIGIDKDGDVATGCDWVRTDHSSVSGIDVLCYVTVDASTETPIVTDVSFSFCENGSFTTPYQVDGGWPVGLNVGIDAADAIEAYLPLGILGRTSALRLYIDSGSTLGGSDILASGGSTFTFPAEIPTLGTVGLVIMLICLLATGIAFVRLRKRLGKVGLTSLLGLLTVLIVFGSMVGFNSDGDVSDWLGFEPLATDPNNDSTDPATDLVAFFAVSDSDNLFFRIDVVDIENHPPVAVDDAFSVNEDSLDNAFNLLLNDSDLDADALTITATGTPSAGGSVTITGGGAGVNYTPLANFFGTETFTYTISDGHNGTDSATVTVTVAAVNDNPNAVDDTFNVFEDTSANALTVLANDSGLPDTGETLTVTAVGATNHGGSAVVGPGGANIAYAPAAGYNGTETFTYTLSDGNGGSDSATVTVTVAGINDAPSFTAGADQTVLEDAGAQSVAGWATVIDDNDPTAQVLTFNVTGNTNPGLFTSGPAIDATTGTLSYTSPADANGSAVVTITLSDNGGTANGGIDTSAPVSFTINVTAVNDVPSFTSGGDVTILEDAGAQRPERRVAWASGISAGPSDESGQVLTFTITNNSNPGLFAVQPTVDGATGELHYQAADNSNGSADITLTLSDDGGTANGGINTSASVTFSITVSGVNDAPTFTAGADQTVLEDAGPQTVAAWATAMDDGDNGSQNLSFTVTSNTNSTLFAAGPAIDATSGDLTYTPTADANGSAAITITLNDDGGTADGGVDTSAPVTFNINVTAVNDVPSFTAGADDEVLQDSGARSVAAWANPISAGPADESGQVLSFTVSGNTNPALFSSLPSVAADGTLTYTPAAGEIGSADITLSLSDDGGTANGGVDTSTDQTFTITVTNVNDAPSFTVGDDQVALEDAGAQTVAGWATNLEDNDPTAQILTFNITGNTNSGLFASGPAINGSTGDLTFTPAADANGTAAITITLSDDGGTAFGGSDTSGPVTFNISVLAVNDVPSFTAGADETVLEFSGAQTVAAWATGLSTGPADESAQNLSFAVTANTNPGLFTVAPSIAADGTLTYTPEGTPGTADITVTIADDGGTTNGGVDTSAGQTFTINVANINDAPSFSAGADPAVLEDAGPQTIAAWATSLNDNDPVVQSLTFNVTGNTNAGLFATGPVINGSTGDLTFTTAADANGTAAITITLSDDGGTANGGSDTSAPVTFNINVTAVNDVPSFTAGADETVLEGSGAQTVAAWATGLSTGPADESAQNLSFAVTANTNPGLFTVAPSIAADGTLTYTPEGTPGTADITVTIADDGGTANGGVDTSAGQTFTINVANINDAPSFSAGADPTVLEDAGPQTIAAWATSLNDNDPVVQSLTFNVTGNTNSGLFATGPAINGSTGDLTFTTAADANGTAAITITLSDDGGTANGGSDTSAPVTFNINVTAVNDVPSFTPGADESILEEASAQTVASWASAISPGPADESAQTTSFNITGVTNAGLFSVAPSIATDGTLTYTPAANTAGTSTVTVEIQDDGGTTNGGSDTSAPITFDIVITGINDEPSFTKGSDVTYLGAATAQTEAGWATALSPGPADESGQTLTFNITGNTNPGLFDAAPAVDGASGDLTFTPAAAATGVTTITLNVQDNGGTANGGDDTSASQTFTISITAQNQEPSFTSGGDDTVLEDSGANTVVGWATNIDDGDGGSQILTFNITGNTNAGLFDVVPAINATTGDLTYTLAANANGTATITVDLSDDGGTAGGGDDTSAAATFDITVTAVNDEPSFTPGANETVPENAGAQTVAGWATALSAGPADEAGQTLTFNITNNTNAAMFSAGPAIDGSGNLTYTTALNANGSATITVNVSDNGGTANGGDDTSAAINFDINVTAVADPPVATADSSYATHPHVSLVVDRAGPSHGFLTSTFNDVLDNDTDPESGTLSVTTIVGSGDTTEPFIGTTTQGGSVEMYADGSFHYHPPATVTNVNDTFQYTLHSTSGSDANGTVTIAIANEDPIWFIDTSAAGGGDGTSRQPFNTHADFLASADDANDTIFIYEGNTTTTPLNGQFTLASGQIIHGEGTALTVIHPEDASSATLVAAGTRPVLVSTAGVVVTLGSGTTVQGVEIRPTAGAGIFSGSSALKQGLAKAGTVSLDNLVVSPTGAVAGVHLGNESGTYNISGSDLRGLAGHTGEGLILETNTAAVNLSNCQMGNNRLALRIISAQGVTTLTDTSITQTTAGFDNQAVTVSGSTGGALNLAGTSSISVANLGAGLNAIDLNPAGGELDLNFAATTSLSLNASGGSDALNLTNFGTGSVVSFAGAVNITAAGDEGVSMDQLVGSVNFDDLAISGVTDDHFLLNNSNATVTVTLDATTGITSSAGRALEITNMTGGSVNMDGGLITDADLGVHITGNAFTASSTIANAMNIDNVNALGLNLANNTGSQLALTGAIDVAASDTQAVNISSCDNVAISSAAVTTTNGGGGGALALNISNVTTLAATFTSVTATNGSGEAINLDTNGGTTTFNNLNLTTTGGIGFDASNAGTLNINNGGSGTATVNTTNALALDINDSAFGATGGTSTFSSITGSGTAGCINLNTTTGTLILSDAAISVSGAAAFVASSATVNVDPGNANSATMAATGQRAFTLSSVTTTGFNFATTSSTGTTSGIVASSCTGTFNFGDTTVTSTGTGVDLSSSASGIFTFDDLDITSSAGVALSGSTAGTINVDSDDNDSPVLSATTGPVLDIDNTKLNMNLATLTSTSPTTHGVDLTNILANSVMGVSGATTVTSPTTYGVNIDDVESGSSLVFSDFSVTNRGSHGIFIQDHDGTTITFGDADIANAGSVGGNGVQIQTSGGGATSTGAVQFASLDISSTNATVNRADAGGDGIPDAETDDGHGVKLIDHTGGVIVTGDGTQANGGTIQTIEGDGFSLTRSGGLNLDEMTINNIGTTNQAAASVDNAGIWAYNLVGSNTITNSTISRFQDGSVAGTSSRGISVVNDGVSFTSLHVTDTTFFNDNSLLGDDGIQVVTYNTVNGAVTVDSAFNLGHASNNNEFYQISGDAIAVLKNGAGTLTTSISDATFRDTITVGGFGGLDLSSAGSGIMSNNVDECLFLALYPGGVNNSGVISLFGSGTTDYDATVNNCTFGSGSQRTSDGRGAIRASTDTSLTANLVDFDITITNNTIDDTDREAISLLPRGGAVPLANGQEMDFVVTGNTIGQTTAVANDAGLGREGIEYVSSENAKLVNLTLANNTITNFVDSSSDETIDIKVNNSTSLVTTISGNTLSQTGSTTDSIDVSINSTGTLCLDMNSANTSSNTCPGGIVITETAGTFSIEDIGGAAISAATVDTYIEARNTGSATVTGTFDSCNDH